MSKVIYQVDSFTKDLFKGNPAGVCILKEAADEDWMKKIAAEMNLSETAFLFPEKEGYNLRWFTPVAEVGLCGHATLASAHILKEKGFVDQTRAINFYTRSGILTAEFDNNLIELNFPSTPPVETSAPDGMLDALGVNDVVYVGKNKSDFLIELSAVKEVNNVEPNFSDLKAVEARGVIVTAEDKSGEYDFISRFFAPSFGIDEDPVTGSAHCTLTPYWSGKLGKTTMKAYQASKRGGEVGVELFGDRVLLRGEAVTVFVLKLV